MRLTNLCDSSLGAVAARLSASLGSGAAGFRRLGTAGFGQPADTRVAADDEVAEGDGRALEVGGFRGNHEP